MSADDMEGRHALGSGQAAPPAHIQQQPYDTLSDTSITSAVRDATILDALSGSAVLEEDESDSKAHIPKSTTVTNRTSGQSGSDNASASSGHARAGPEPDLATNRLSFSSLYSLGSVLYDRARATTNSSDGQHGPTGMVSYHTAGIRLTLYSAGRLTSCQYHCSLGAVCDHCKPEWIIVTCDECPSRADHIRVHKS